MGKLTHTVKGPIASFRSADKAPIESLKLHFLPKQEGSGDPSPTNIRPITGWTGLNGFGANENLISLQDLTLANQSSDINTIRDGGDLKLTVIKNTTAWVGSSQEAYYNIPPALQGKEIFFTVDSITLETVNKDNQRATVVCEFRDANNAFITDPTVVSYTIDGSSNTLGRKVTIPTNAKIMRLYFRIAQNIANYGVYIGDYIIFHNFCIKYKDNHLGFKQQKATKLPITFPSNGKNLVNDETTTLKNWTTKDGHRYISTNTDTRDSVSMYVVQYGPNDVVLKNNVKYTPVVIGRNSLTIDVVKGCNKILLKHNGVVRDFGVFIPWDGRVGTYTISANFESIDLSTVGGFIFSDVQIELGDTMTSYEPYSSDNTFYGGYIDPVAGEIVAEYISKICDGTETGWNTNSTSGSNTRFHISPSGLGLPKPVNSSTSLAKFSYFNSSSSPSAWNGFIGSTGNVLFFVPTEIASTVTEWRGYLSEHNLQICYKLEIPIHIPIPAEDMKTFLDYNNFWSDTNDDTEVEYAFADRLSERKLIMDTPHIASASGSVASFNTDLKAPIVDLKAHFTPVQEGSGDPSPSNIRPITGYTKCNLNHSHRNLIKPYHTQETTVRGLTITPTANGVRVQGTASVEYAIRLSSQEIRYLEKDKIYAFSLYINGDISGCKDPYLGYHDGTTYISIQNLTELNNYSYVWTVPERYSNAVNPWFDMYIRVKKNSTVDFEIGLKMEEGSSVTAYEPYFGETIPIEFPATKNLYDNKFTGITGSLTYHSYYLGVSSQVTVSTDCPQTDEGAGTSPWSNIFVLPGIVSDGASTAVNDVHDGLVRTVTPINGYITLAYRNWLGVDPRNYHTQIEIGSVATPYEPYGTVYGGYVDLVRGKIIAEWRKIKLKYCRVYLNSNAPTAWHNWHAAPPASEPQMTTNFTAYECPTFCDTFWAISMNGGDLTTTQEAPVVWCSSVEGNFRFKYVADCALTAEEFKTKYGEMEMCYRMSTPIEYDITPEQIKTFKGMNNIWADTNGDIEVSYWTH